MSTHTTSYTGLHHFCAKHTKEHYAGKAGMIRSGWVTTTEFPHSSLACIQHLVS